MAIAHMTLEQELQRAGIRMSVESYYALVLDAAHELATTVVSDDPANELTAAERDAVLRGGGSFDNLPSGVPDPRALGAAQFTALLANSYTVEEVAKMLNVDRSRVRQRLGERSLYGVKLRGSWRIPRFQFVDCDLIPGMEQVIAAMPANMDLLGWFNWFTLPDPDLEIDDVAVSPAEWLRRGGDPGIVAAMAADFEYGL